MACQKITWYLLTAVIALLVAAASAAATPLYADNIIIGADSIRIEIQKKKLKPNIVNTIKKNSNDRITITVPSVKFYDKAINNKNVGDDAKEDVIRTFSVKNIKKNKKELAQISVYVKNLKLVNVSTTSTLSKTIITISSKTEISKENQKILAQSKPAESEEEHGETPAGILTGVALADESPARIASMKISMGQIRILADKKIGYKIDNAQGDGVITLSNVTGFIKPRVQDVKDDIFDNIELKPLDNNKLQITVHPVKPGTIYAVETNDNSNELRIISYQPVSLSNLRITDDGPNKKVSIVTKDPIYNYKILNRDNLKSFTLAIPNGRLGANKNIEGQNEDVSYKLTEQDNKLTITISFSNKYIVQERVVHGTRLEFDLVRAKETPAGGKIARTVAIDPGHGGNDNGADGDYSHEKDINLAISMNLKNILAKKYNVVMTRQDDRNLSLPERIDIINSNKADLSVSVHCNSSQKTGIKGFETYYFAPVSSNLASIIHLSLQQNIARDERGIKRQPFAMIKYMAMPAILIETEYISNSEGETFLNDPANQEAYARAIADGIDKYFSYIDTK